MNVQLAPIALYRFDERNICRVLLSRTFGDKKKSRAELTPLVSTAANVVQTQMVGNVTAWLTETGTRCTCAPSFHIFVTLSAFLTYR